MNEKCELYKLLEFLLDVDISYIINDVLGPNFEDIEIPSNVDEDDCTIEVNTPKGLFTISITNKKDLSNKVDVKEVIFRHPIDDFSHEEYSFCINSNSIYDFVLDGKLVEFREKGFIVNSIMKKYLYDSEERKVTDLLLASKKKEVYPLSELDNMHILGDEPEGVNSKDKKVLMPIIAHVGEPYVAVLITNIMETEMVMSIMKPFTDKEFYWHPLLDVNYNYGVEYPILPGNNVVGRAYDLFEGIITEENYPDADYLINAGLFNRYFAFYDCHSQEGEKTTNEKIDELIGPSLSSSKKEYSNLVKKVVEEYYEHVKYNPSSEEQTDKKKELEKNNYIKEILLSNHNM